MSDARTEALARFPYPVDVHTGEPVDDWGYEQYAREAFIAGAEWQAERIAQVIEAEADGTDGSYADGMQHAARIARGAGKK